MSNLPDFSNHGFIVVRELGHNLSGGRVAYLARSINTDKNVAIKQFQFAQTQANWSGFKAYEREIEVLQKLNHPGIPRYLDSFETPTGFCMVQEYKNAQTLARWRSFDPDEIKEIAISLLEILVYLQSRIPSVIHRDIKPENILVDSDINVYLIDFGFARIGSSEVAMSSIALGTLGFMAPEQMYGRQLTKATDLYGLGATLICLLTGTKSTAMNTLIDEDGHIAFKHLLPQMSSRFINWLEKLVHPKQKYRFTDAEAALKALITLYLRRLPEVKLDKSILEFRATKLGEPLTRTITVSNSIPATILEGRWEVAPHPSDPPHTPETHAWICFQPIIFSGNQATSSITVDTTQLRADSIYQRQILLHTNSSPETHTIFVKVQTASLPIANKKPPYASLAILLLTSGAAVLSGSVVAAVLAAVSMTVVGASIVNVDDVVFGAVVAALVASLFGLALGSVFGSLAAVFVAIEVWAITKTADEARDRTASQNLEKEGFGKCFAVVLVLLTATFGGCLGIGLRVGFFHQWLMFAFVFTGSALTSVLVYPSINRRRRLAKYRQSEQHLIKP